MTKKKAKKKKKDLFGLLDLPDEITTQAREVWLAGLGALSAVEEEGTKVFNGLVKKGKAVEKAGRKKIKAARKMLDEAADEVVSKPAEVTKDIEKKVTESVEETVEAVLHRLGVPTRQEVQDLSAKVEKLAKQVSKLGTVLEKNAGNGQATTVYHVVPHDEGWAVKLEGVSTPEGEYATKGEAVKEARNRAKAQEPSRLVVHRQDGTIQDSFSYGS